MVVLHLLETRIGLELLDLSLHLLTVHQNLLADGLHAADFPVRHAPPALHAVHLVDIQQVESFPHLPQQSGQNCFVLDGVEGAGGVDDESAALELVDGLHEDGQLQRVQRDAVAGVPLGPLDGQLAGGPVAGAGHIAEDLVEEELLLDVVDLSGVELGQELARVVDHGHARSARAVYLMDEHLRATVVCVICDHAALLQALLAAVEHLEQLRGLGAGGSAHVEDDIGGLDVEEERGQHGDQLLTGDESCVEGLLQVLVQVVEHLALLEDLLGGVDLVQHVARVPGQDFDPGRLLGLVLLLLLELLGLVLIEHGGEEVGVLDLLAEGVKVGTAGVDAEDHRQLFLHGSPEELELLLGQLELQLVVVAEEGVVLRYSGAAPLVLDLFVPVRVGLELASAFAHIVGTYKRNLNLTHDTSYHCFTVPCSISSGCTCSTDSMSMELMELREEVPESFSSSKSQKRDSFFSSMRSRWEVLLRLRLFLFEEIEKRGLKVSLILKKVNSLFSLFRTCSPSFSLGLSSRLLLLFDSWLDRSSSMFRSGLSKSGRFVCCRVSDFRFLPTYFFLIGNIFSLGFGKPSKKLDSSIVDLLRSEAFEDDFSLSSATSSISSFAYIIYQDCSCSALVAQKWKCPVCQFSLSTSSSLLESASEKSICRSFSTQNWEGLTTLEIRLSMGVDSMTLSSQHERSPPASLLVLLILISSVISSLCVFSFSELMEEYSVRNLLPKVLELKQLSPAGCLLGGRMTMLTYRSLREAFEVSLSLSQMESSGLVRLLWMGILLPVLCLALSLSLELGERFLSLRLRRQSEESCLIISGSVCIMAELSKLSLSLEVSSMFWYSLLFSSMRLLLLKVSGMRHFQSEGSPSRRPLMTRVRMAWQRSARNLSSASPTSLRLRWQSTQQALKQSSLAMLSSFMIFLRMQPAVSNLEWAMLSRKTSNLRISRPSSNNLSWLAFSSRKDCVNFSSSLCCELTDSFSRYSLSVFTLIQNLVKGAMITLLPLRHSGMYMWKEVSSLPYTLIRISLGSHSAPSWQSSQVRNSTLQTKLFLFLLRKVLRLSGSQAVEFLRRRRVRPCRVSLLYLMKLVLLKARSSRNNSTWQLVWCSFRSWQRKSAQMLFTSSSNCPCSTTSPITACDNSQMSAEQSLSSWSSTACSILRLLLRNSSSEQSCVLSCGKRQSCSQFPRGLLAKQRRMKLQIWSRVQYSVEKRNMASLSLLQRMVFFSFIFAKKSLRVLPMQLTLLLQQLKFTDNSSPELHKSTSSSSSATHLSRSQPSSRLSCERKDDDLLRMWITRHLITSLLKYSWQEHSLTLVTISSVCTPRNCFTFSLSLLLSMKRLKRSAGKLRSTCLKKSRLPQKMTSFSKMEVLRYLCFSTTLYTRWVSFSLISCSLRTKMTLSSSPSLSSASQSSKQLLISLGSLLTTMIEQFMSRTLAISACRLCTFSTTMFRTDFCSRLAILERYSTSFSFSLRQKSTRSVRTCSSGGMASDSALSLSMMSRMFLKKHTSMPSFCRNSSMRFDSSYSSLLQKQSTVSLCRSRPALPCILKESCSSSQLLQTRKGLQHADCRYSSVLWQASTSMQQKRKEFTQFLRQDSWKRSSTSGMGQKWLSKRSPLQQEGSLTTSYSWTTGIPRRVVLTRCCSLVESWMSITWWWCLSTNSLLLAILLMGISILVCCGSVISSVLLRARMSGMFLGGIHSSEYSCKDYVIRLPILEICIFFEFQPISQHPPTLSNVQYLWTDKQVKKMDYYPIVRLHY